MTNIIRTERTEWRVESETTEDEFGTDEQEAREWLTHCKDQPYWEPAVLMRRTVVVEESAWTEAD